MSIESCTTFLRTFTSSDELKQQMKAVTDPKEVIAIGKRYGYTFDTQDIIAASASLGAELSASEPSTPAQANADITSAFYHYEFGIEQIPGFEEVARELQHLKIKPATVNLSLYEKSYREEDFQFTSLSPAAPEFNQRYEEVMHPHWQDAESGSDFSRRDFHLVNIDQHVNHPSYEQYFQAKTRLIASLETFFDSEVRFSGSMWYPPFAYRLWHTNETQAGWRMYLIDFDEFAGNPKGTSFFRYMNPQSKEIVTLEERPKIVRFFKIEQEKEKLFWHCIVNATTRNRWSFGFVVPDNWMEQIAHLIK
ncbi:MAG: Nif11-like leader peptide family natural product precursor [Ktedonobacteraceae bacterium]